MTDDKKSIDAFALLNCPAGHLAEFWIVNGWVMAGCKICGHAAAAYKSFEQSEHDWNAMMAQHK